MTYKEAFETLVNELNDGHIGYLDDAIGKVYEYFELNKWHDLTEHSDDMPNSNEIMMCETISGDIIIASKQLNGWVEFLPCENENGDCEYTHKFSDIVAWKDFITKEMENE